MVKLSDILKQAEDDEPVYQTELLIIHVNQLTNELRLIRKTIAAAALLQAGTGPTLAVDDDERAGGTDDAIFLLRELLDD